MPIAHALVTHYFQLMVSRQFSEAERELERIKQKMQKTEWNRGYFRALYGMLLSRRGNGDNYALFPKLDLSDKVALHAYRREFIDHSRNGLHGDFDRGYFSAWDHRMRVLAMLEIAGASAPAEKGAVSEKEKLETLRSDKSQATITNFTPRASKE